MMRIPTYGQFQSEADMISQQFNNMNNLEAQASSGQQIQYSYQDPVLGAQIKSNQDFLSLMQTYTDSGALAQNRGKEFSTAMQISTSALSDVQNLVRKAQDTTLTPANRLAIAQQLQGDLSSLLGAAATRDADGSYIFGGTSTNTVPYIQVNGSYQYQGSSNPTSIDIAPNVSTLYTENGDSVFGGIYSGNGTFAINAGTGNTGGAYTTPGNVVNSSSYVPDNYTMTFATVGGQLTYSVVGAASGTVLSNVVFPIPNTQGVNVNFQGLTFSVAGTPSAGDTFSIQPSTQQNIFNSIQSVITTLSNPNPITNIAAFNQQMSQLSSTIVQGSTQITSYMSQVGVRELQVNNQVTNNNASINNQKINLSNISDADIVAVFSALAQQSIALQATQEGYMKLQDTLTKILRL